MRHIIDRYLLTICLAMFTASGASAQSFKELVDKFDFDGINVLSSKDSTDVVAKAVFPDLYIIRQQYRLELNGDFFGKDGRQYYGETYSLGIKVSGGMLLLDDVIEPWKNDADYHRVNADGKYKTEYFWTYQRRLDESIYKTVEMEIGTAHTVPINQGESLWLHEDHYRELGLDVDASIGHKEGYMIWVSSKTSIADSAMKVNVSQSALCVDVRGDSSLLVMSPEKLENIIGGLFVVPKYSSGGRVQFVLAGVAVRTSDSGWGLQMLINEESRLPKAAVSGDTAVEDNADASTLSEDPSTISPKAKKGKNRKK